VGGRRNFDQHVALYVTYGDRVARLPTVAWERLRVRCAALNGPAFRSLVSRALLAAKPYEVWLPRPTTVSPGLRAIVGASRVVQTSLAFAFEVVAEFEGSSQQASCSPRPRTRSTGRARTDAFVDASFLIESALAPLQRTDPGVVTAVRAAGQAVLRHDWLTVSDFDAVYSYIEPEIPFADLEPPAGDPTSVHQDV
jgi:hypothetical protein